MYLLVHTMTITKSDCVIQAQFFHTVNNTVQANDFRLVGKRLSLRIHPNLRRNHNKLNLQRMNYSNLKTAMKRSASHIKHQLHAIHISTQNRPSNQLQNHIEDAGLGKFNQEQSPTHSIENNYSNINSNVFPTEQLLPGSSPQLIVNWLTANRFDKYLSTFSNFCGADMLRMSRDDLIQICGQADGIRLYNTMHSKAIAPKLTIYVCRENSTVFNAIFLSTLTSMDLIQKLTNLTGFPEEQVRDIYIQGPQSIHVHLNNEVIKHIKEETMFMLEIIQDNGSLIFILKPIIK